MEDRYNTSGYTLLSEAMFKFLLALKEARTEWRESGKCCPRVSSVKDVLSCMVKVLTTSGQEFTLGLFLNTNQLFERDAVGISDDE